MYAESRDENKLKILSYNKELGCSSLIRSLRRNLNYTQKETATNQLFSDFKCFFWSDGMERGGPVIFGFAK